MPTVLEFRPEILDRLQSKQTLRNIAENKYYDRSYLRLSQDLDKVSAFNKSDWNFHIVADTNVFGGDIYDRAQKELSEDIDEHLDAKKILINHYTAETGTYDPITPWMIHHRAWHFLIRNRHSGWFIDWRSLFDTNPLYIDYPLLGMILDTRCMRPGGYFTSPEDIDAEYFASFCHNGIKLKTFERAIGYAEYLMENPKVDIRIIEQSSANVFVSKSKIDSRVWLKEEDINTCLAVLKSFRENPEENLLTIKNYTVLRMELFLKISLLKQYLSNNSPVPFKYIGKIIDHALKNWLCQYSYWDKTRMHYVKSELKYYSHEVPSNVQIPERLHRELTDIFEMINKLKTFKFL